MEGKRLFPVMARGNPEQVGTLRTEHQHVHVALCEIAAGHPPAQDCQPRLRTAIAVCSEHIEKEQDGLFPAAPSTLDDRDWTALDPVLAWVGSA